MKLKILVLVALLAMSSAVAGGWKWKTSRGSTAAPVSTMLADGYTPDGWSWGGEE